MVIKLRHSWLDLEDRYFFDRAVQFAVHFRKDLNFVKRVAAQPQCQARSIREALREWDQSADSPAIDDILEFPANLRVFPPFAKLNERDFPAYANEPWCLRTVTADTDGLVSLVKDIFEHGI